METKKRGHKNKFRDGNASGSYGNPSLSGDPLLYREGPLDTPRSPSSAVTLLLSTVIARAAVWGGGGAAAGDPVAVGRADAPRCIL